MAQITLAEYFEALTDFARRYRADADVRARIARGDTSDLGPDFPDSLEVRVVEQTADTYYLPMPQQPTGALSDEALAGTAGGSYIPPGLPPRPDYSDFNINAHFSVATAVG